MLSSGFVNLFTNHIEEAIRFYCELLGFEETYRTPREGAPEHAEFRINGFALGLGTVEAARRVHGVEPEPGRASGAIVLWCDDVDALFQRLVGANAPVVQTPHDMGSSNRNAMVRDPDGNLVEIVSKRG